MTLPRDLSGADLARVLTTVGYSVSRQTGSHLRLTTQHGGEQHVTIPNHEALRGGTLAGILSAVADHLGVGRDEVIPRLVGGRQ